MSLKKVTLASLILLSLTACSGGGGSSAPVAKNDKKPTVQQPAKPANKAQDNAKQAEADSLAKQKAEEERLKKEEADRLAKQKAEEERLKKEEADRLAKQKAEEERLKKEEYLEINSAKFFVYPETLGDQVKIRYFNMPENLENNSLNRNIRATEENIVRNDRETGETVTSYEDIYNQRYSVVLAKEYQGYKVIGHSGLKTLPENFVSQGKATYEGLAFTKDQQGKLTYTVDFDKREGYGKIENINQLGEVLLEKGDIYKKVSENKMVIEAKATPKDWKEHQVTGTYNLGFYGKNAEEIAGSLSLHQEHSIYNEKTGEIDSVSKSLDESVKEIGFGGTRGEITK